MKIKNISKSGFTVKLGDFEGKIISLKPGEAYAGIPTQCYKVFKGTNNVIMICWENDNEKSIFEKLNPCYYTVGIFENTSNVKEDESNNSEEPSVIEVTEVTVEPDSLNLKVAEKTALKVTVIPEDATDKKVTITTSDENVVKITKKGNLEAVGVGSAVITASASNGVKAECTVTVEDEVEESTEEVATDTEPAGDETPANDATPENTEETQQ